MGQMLDTLVCHYSVVQVVQWLAAWNEKSVVLQKDLNYSPPPPLWMK